MMLTQVLMRAFNCPLPFPSHEPHRIALAERIAHAGCVPPMHRLEMMFTWGLFRSV